MSSLGYATLKRYPYVDTIELDKTSQQSEIDHAISAQD